jgi:hypothetical protein
MIYSPFAYRKQQVSEPGPSYVTSGLTLYWDGANYSGSGDWLDLSGNGNDGTFFGAAPTGKTDFGGVVFFGGTNTYCVNTGVTTDGSDFTLMYAGQYVAGGSTGRIFSSYFCSSYNSLLGHWSGTVDSCYINNWYRQGNTYNNNWHITALKREGSVSSASSYRLYLDDVYTAPDPGFPPNTSTQYSGVSIAAYGEFVGSPGEFSTCNVGFVMWYNRALSDAELTENFDYFKNRYGL